MEQSEELLQDNIDVFSSIREHYESGVALTTSEMDAIADLAIMTLKDLLNYFGESSYTINEYEGDEGELILDVNMGDFAVLIGRHGRTLEALQMVLTSLLSSRMKFYYPVVVDIESYKNRRRKKVISIAENAAQKACDYHTDIVLNPMSGYDRRLVHLTLRSREDVETYSVGKDPYRKVVISPK